MRYFEMRMEKFKQEDWRDGDLLQILKRFNIEVFRHIYCFPNELAESLNLFL